MKSIQNTVFEAEAAVMSAPGSDSFKQDKNNVQEKAELLKQLLLQPAWKIDDVEKPLADLKLADAALKAKLQEEQDKQQASGVLIKTVTTETAAE